MFQLPSSVAHWNAHSVDRNMASVPMSRKFKLSMFKLTRFDCGIKLFPFFKNYITHGGSNFLKIKRTLQIFCSSTHYYVTCLRLLLTSSTTHSAIIQLHQIVPLLHNGFFSLFCHKQEIVALSNHCCFSLLCKSANFFIYLFYRQCL